MSLPALVGRFDDWADAQLEPIRGNPVADAVFTAASKLGEFSLIWHVTNVVRGITGIGTVQQIPVFAALVGAESLVVNQGIKRLFRRTRPTEAGDDRFPVRRPTTSSFPSGHASSAAFAATVLTGWDGRRLAPLWWTMASTVAVSRAYVRIHHGSDVVAGPRHRCRPRRRRSPPAEGRSTSAESVSATWQAGPMPDDGPVASKVAVADRQMSDAEALMWRVEKDPYLASTFGTVTILDRAPDFDHLRARMESAVHAVPRLGWRVQPNPTGLGAPIWADDPDFDIDLHVRRVALPAPGTRRQLLDLASLFVLDPLDRTRPLWQFLVVEGLEGGKAALVTKMHHTITDGVNGVRMSMQYVDLTRAATVPAGGKVESHDPAPAPSPNTVDTVLRLRRGDVPAPDQRRAPGP